MSAKSVTSLLTINALWTHTCYLCSDQSVFLCVFIGAFVCTFLCVYVCFVLFCFWDPFTLFFLHLPHPASSLSFTPFYFSLGRAYFPLGLTQSIPTEFKDESFSLFLCLPLSLSLSLIVNIYIIIQLLPSFNQSNQIKLNWILVHGACVWHGHCWHWRRGHMHMRQIRMTGLKLLTLCH